MLFSSISFIERALITKHLSVMIRSGIPIVESLSIIEEQASNPEIKRVIRLIRQDVSNGKTLYQSMQKHPSVFDALYVGLIKLGEQSGNLEDNLNYLADQMKKNYEFSQKVKGALMYPSIVLSTAVAVGAGLSLFVLPSLVDLFKSLDVTLPLATRILLWIATLMKEYGVLIVGGTIGLIFFLKLFVNLKVIKPLWHALLLRVPVLGPFLQSVELSFFSRNLGMMLKSGLPIMTALDTLQLSTSNLVYTRSIREIRSGVEKGKTIEATILDKRLPFFPKIVTRMIGVGEKTGKLDESLLYLGGFFEDEVDDRAKNFSVVLEPIMLLFVGIAVAFVAFAIISPIYEFTGSIKRP